jgi:outer membrane protein assembly factor BamD
MRVSLSLRFFLLLLVMFAIGCHRDKKTDDAEVLPVDQMYSTAKAALVENNLNKAIKYYERLIARFPFGPYTEQSDLELAYAQWKIGKPEDGYSTINRFIKTYPTQKHIDYAYYLRGIINFDRDRGILDKYANQDMTKRDQGNTLQSFEDFNELVTKFPNSRYTPDARQRMIYLRDNLAEAQLHRRVLPDARRHVARSTAAGHHREIPAHPQVGDAWRSWSCHLNPLGQTSCRKTPNAF